MQVNEKVNWQALHKLLYKAALFCVHPDFRSDSEAVRAKRDQSCSQLFGKPYDQLTVNETYAVINELQKQSGYQKTKTENPKREYANSNMVGKLRYSMVYCALRYCPLDGYSITTDDGRILAESELREHLIAMYAKKKGVPSNILNHLYTAWINPKCNEYMVSKGFKKRVEKPENFYHGSLSPDECQYLINVFREMETVIGRKDVDVSKHVPVSYSKN